MDFSTMDNEALTAALADIEKGISTASDEALAASLVDITSAMRPMFSIASPTTEHAAKVSALSASARAIKTEQKRRADEVEKASAAFAAARAEFSEDTDEDTDEETGDETGDETGEETSEETSEETGDETGEETGDETGEEAGEGAVTAAAPLAPRPLTGKALASKVATRNKRPQRSDTSKVVITASADIPNVPMGSALDDMTAVAKALVARATAFAPYNEAAGRANYEANGGQPMLNKAAVASFAVQHENTGGDNSTERDYNATKHALDKHKEALSASMQSALNGGSVPDSLAAAMAWCAPSEVVYNWIADYVVDGIKRIPEIQATRGGLLLTEGPRLAQENYANIEEFGFGGTEAEMEAGYIKTCETIECPEFVDHRLDFDGYCWKIPILTESAFPELVADALRYSDAQYAHKINRRTLRDIITESTVVDATPYGGSFLDTIEAVTQIAVKERRWWNIGENAIMEVTLPQWVRDVFKLDMARRSGLALNDVATDQKIAAHFANHNLAVEYVSDLRDLAGPEAAQADWPGSFPVIVYPSGTFVQARKPVINLSAVYDAASLSENEYTGVFFEQGIKTIKRGYRSHVVNIPVCTSGTTGANLFACEGGSF